MMAINFGTFTTKRKKHLKCYWKLSSLRDEQKLRRGHQFAKKRKESQRKCAREIFPLAKAEVTP